MSPVAEAIKETGSLLVSVATLVTAIVALVKVLQTKRLVNSRTDQLLEAVKYKGVVEGMQSSKLDAREDRREVIETAKSLAATLVTPAPAPALKDEKKEEPK